MLNSMLVHSQSAGAAAPFPDLPVRVGRGSSKGKPFGRGFKLVCCDCRNSCASACSSLLGQLQIVRVCVVHIGIGTDDCCYPQSPPPLAEPVLVRTGARCRSHGPANSVQHERSDSWDGRVGLTHHSSSANGCLFRSGNNVVSDYPVCALVAT